MEQPVPSARRSSARQAGEDPNALPLTVASDVQAAPRLEG
jgi:hypothetical protein